jgi:hypothetical protein
MPTSARLASVLLGLLVAGCGTTAGHDQTASLAERFAGLGDNVGELKAGVDESLQALDTLTRGGARAAFATISASVPNLSDATTKLKGEMNAAQLAATQHFDAWGQHNGTINDAAIKARAEDRRNDLTASLTNLSGTFARATAMNESFVATLADLQKYLSNDLSAQAVGNAGDLIAKVRGEGGRASAALGSLGNDVSHLASKMRGN